MKINANLYIFYFSVPQQKEVAGVWYRDHEGKQFLKIALPADAWSMAATIKTRKGVHRMTMDRWGDSTHKMSAYNNRYHPPNRDQRQIDRMERETMVLYPNLQPNPVLPKRSPGFSGGRGMFRGLNWRAEGLRFQPSRNELESEREKGPSTSSFYKQQREAAPFVTRRRFHRKSPSRRPHRRTPYYPPSPQYRGDSTSEDEAVQVPAAKGKYTDPTPTPIPRDELDSMEEQEGSGKEEESPGYATPPEGLPKTTQQLHTALFNQLDRALQEALDKPGPSCLRKQGGGDREPTPGPQALRQGELNLATENWSLIPNKVRFMDEPDTYRANVGRHRETQPRLVRAKTYPHLVFADPPASPDRETSRSPREQRAASQPPGETPKVTPDSTTSQELPSLEMHEAPPVPLEPEVEVINPWVPSPPKDDSDCEIVEPPMPFKPKKGWAKKRSGTNQKDIGVVHPKDGRPSIKKRGRWSLSDGEPCPTS